MKINPISDEFVFVFDRQVAIYSVSGKYSSPIFYFVTMVKCQQ